MKNYLSERRMELGLTMKQVADAVGVSEATVSRWENGRIANMRRDRIAAYAKILNVDPTFIMTGELKEDNDKNDLPSASNIIPLPHTHRIPLLGEIACGEPITAEENVESLISIPDNIHADFALRCKGDSMIGARIMDGDIVYIRQQPDVDDGEIAAVLIGNEATLKRVYKVPGRLQLRAENPNFAPINLEGDELENVRILGKAVAFTSPVK